MKRFLIAASLLLIIGQAHAQSSVEDILKQVGQNNLTLQALSHEGEAAVLDIRSGNQLSGPSVEYSPFFGGGYSGVAESELIVKEDFDFPTKYSDRRKQAALLERTNQQEWNRQRRDILLQAELLCLDIIRVNQTMQMLERRLEGSQTLQQMYEKRIEAGDANIFEINKIKLDCMEVQTLISEAGNERTQLLLQLQQLNGGQPVDITTTEMPSFPRIADYDSFVHQALLVDADVQLAEASLLSAQHEVSLSKKEWLPSLSVGYRRNTEMKSHVDGVLLGVSFPLLVGSNRTKAARHREQNAELQVQQARQEAEGQLRSRYEQYANLQRVLDHTDVQMMTETLSLLRKALEHGEISALQYYTEINGIYEKLQRHIDVHCQSTKLLAQLHMNEL